MTVGKGASRRLAALAVILGFCCAAVDGQWSEVDALLQKSPPDYAGALQGLLELEGADPSAAEKRARLLSLPEALGGSTKGSHRDAQGALRSYARAAEGGEGFSAVVLHALSSAAGGQDDRASLLLEQAVRKGDMWALLAASHSASQHEAGSSAEAEALASARFSLLHALVSLLPDDLDEEVTPPLGDADRFSKELKAALGGDYASNVLLERFMAAAQQGDEQAMLQVGQWHDKGLLGLSRDRATAQAFYIAAAERGSLAGMHLLAKTLLADAGIVLGVTNTVEEANSEPASQAVALLQAGAESGDHEAMGTLGAIVMTGIRVDGGGGEGAQTELVGSDRATAQALLEKAAASGSASALCFLGMLALTDPASASQGVSLLVSAAENGSARALKVLGDASATGSGPVAVSIAASSEAYRQLAERFLCAPVVRGAQRAAFEDGDEAGAALGLLVAAHCGCEAAQAGLAWMIQQNSRVLASGFSIPAEKAEALADEMLVRSAKAGNPDSSFVVGKRKLKQGDARSSAEFLVPAAEAGHADAVRQVAKMYELGDGLPRDAAMALRLYKVLWKHAREPRTKTSPVEKARLLLAMGRCIMRGGSSWPPLAFIRRRRGILPPPPLDAIRQGKDFVVYNPQVFMIADAQDPEQPACLRPSGSFGPCDAAALWYLDRGDGPLLRLAAVESLSGLGGGSGDAGDPTAAARAGPACFFVDAKSPREGTVALAPCAATSDEQVARWSYDGAHLAFEPQPRQKKQQRLCLARERGGTRALATTCDDARAVRAVLSIAGRHNAEGLLLAVPDGSEGAAATESSAAGGLHAQAIGTAPLAVMNGTHVVRAGAGEDESQLGIRFGVDVVDFSVPELGLRIFKTRRPGEGVQSRLGPECLVAREGKLTLDDCRVRGAEGWSLSGGVLWRPKEGLCVAFEDGAASDDASLPMSLVACGSSDGQHVSKGIPLQLAL